MISRFINDRPFITTDDIVLLASHIELSGERCLFTALSEIGINPRSFNLSKLADELWDRFEISVVV